MRAALEVRQRFFDTTLSPRHVPCGSVSIGTRLGWRWTALSVELEERVAHLAAQFSPSPTRVPTTGEARSDRDVASTAGLFSSPLLDTFSGDLSGDLKAAAISLRGSTHGAGPTIASGKDASVSGVKVKSTMMNDARAASCVVDRLRRMTFPAPRGGGMAILSYPFLFAPS